MMKTTQNEKIYSFKVIIGGAGGVGKTTLLHRYMEGKFLPDSTMTIGVAFQVKEIAFEGLQQKVKMCLWDLGGQARFRFLHQSYMAGAMAGVVFFDMTRLDTMVQVKDWVWMFRKYTPPDMPIVLGGTKLDVVDDPIMIDELSLYAKETVADLGLQLYIPTSSKTGQGVNEIFTYIINTLLAQYQTKK
jgi:small GTP-binding protein